MAVLFLAHKHLDALFEKLRHCGELHGPVRGEDGVVRYTPLAPCTAPDLAAVRTHLPPKKYLLHPVETILNYSAQAGYELPQQKMRPLILCGIHPCDLAGIAYLDRIYLTDDPDPLYEARRTAVTLIGISCTPDDLCSCSGTQYPLPAASDLFLSALEDGFVVTSSSSKGDELLETLKDILEKRELDPPADTRRFFGSLDAERLHPELDPSLPEWQQLADDCLGCGACSICCPTCSCFDVIEFGGLDGRSAERVRRWDNCLFKSHSRIAGGMSFMGNRAERFRYRYIHKYRGFGPLQGIPGCVGCGRCRAVCPTGLDLRPLAVRLEGAAT